MSKPVNRQVELRELLEQLNLGGMASIFAETALRAAKEHLTHEAYLWELATHERDLRTQRRTARLLRASGLPTEKTFRTFDPGKLPAVIQTQVERLKRGAFLESATNVVAVGRPGVGKSHVLAAVGYELVCLGYPVLWLPTSTLVQRLLAAKRDLRLPQELAKLDKFACVFSMIWVISSKIAMKWRCCLPFSANAMNANRSCSRPISSSASGNASSSIP